MNVLHTTLGKDLIPQRYIPKSLKQKDKIKQRKNLKKSRKLYKKGIYYSRPKVDSFKSKESPHIKNLKKMYAIENIEIPELAKKLNVPRMH